MSNHRATFLFQRIVHLYQTNEAFRLYCEESELLKRLRIDVARYLRTKRLPAGVRRVSNLDRLEVFYDYGYRHREDPTFYQLANLSVNRLIRLRALVATEPPVATQLTIF